MLTRNSLTRSITHNKCTRSFNEKGRLDYMKSASGIEIFFSYTVDGEIAFEMNKIPRVHAVTYNKDFKISNIEFKNGFSVLIKYTEDGIRILDTDGCEIFFDNELHVTYMRFNDDNERYVKETRWEYDVDNNITEIVSY